MEDYEINAIKEWKEKVETELATIKETIEQKKVRSEQLLIMINVVSHATKNYSSVEKNKDEYWGKYGQPLEQESKILIDETTNQNSELNVERKELQCLLNSINQLLSKVVSQ